MSIPNSLLIPVKENPINISHFMHLVSAYEPSPEMVRRLGESLREAQLKAERDEQPVIVDQDSSDFFFVVGINGRIQLCAVLRSFENLT